MFEEHNNSYQVRPDSPNPHTDVPTLGDAERSANDSDEHGELKAVESDDARTREIVKRRAERKYEGRNIPLNPRDPNSILIYKLDSEKFKQAELVRTRELVKATSKRGYKGLHIVDEMLGGFDRGEWSDTRSLQGWMSGRHYYKGARAKKPLLMPGTRYLMRLCFAARAALLDKIDPTGNNGKRGRCSVCEELKILICRDCWDQKEKRKPAQSETMTRTKKTSEQ